MGRTYRCEGVEVESEPKEREALRRACATEEDRDGGENGFENRALRNRRLYTGLMCERLWEKDVDQRQITQGDDGAEDVGDVVTG